MQFNRLLNSLQSVVRFDDLPFWPPLQNRPYLDSPLREIVRDQDSDLFCPFGHASYYAR